MGLKPIFLPFAPWSCMNLEDIEMTFKNVIYLCVNTYIFMYSKFTTW